jgi:hypothetical protein
MPGDEDPRTAVNDFLVECAGIAKRLDAVDVRDDRGVIATVVAQGRSDYDGLVGRKDALWMTNTEASLVQTMMDRVLARLKFLEKRV